MIVLANLYAIIKMTQKKLKKNKVKKMQDKRELIRMRLKKRIKKLRPEELPISHPMRPLTLIPEVTLEESSYEETPDGSSLQSITDYPEQESNGQTTFK